MMRKRLGALALAAGAAAALVPAAPAAAIPTPIPKRIDTISVAGDGTCWSGTAEGRLSWSPRPPVGSVRVTATVVNVQYPPDPDGDGAIECTTAPNTNAVFTAYAGTTVVDRQQVNADDGVTAISFELSGSPLTAIDRVEVSMCWMPEHVVLGVDPIEECDKDSRRIS
jgi:hypothetical protein